MIKKEVQTSLKSVFFLYSCQIHYVLSSGFSPIPLFKAKLLPCIGICVGSFI